MTTTTPTPPARFRTTQDLTHINNLTDLRLEQKRVRLRVKLQEKELRIRVKKIPGELAMSAVKTIVPAFLAGKLTDSALGGLRAGVNMLFTKDKTTGGMATGLAGGLVKGLVKRVGVFTALRMAYNLIKKKK